MQQAWMDGRAFGRWMVAASLLLCGGWGGGVHPALASEGSPPVSGETVETYAIAADGGLVYDPLSREARRTGQLDRYAQAPTRPFTLETGGLRLTARLPRQATAYDVIPISYTLEWPQEGSAASSAFPVGVEAVAFEEEPLRQGRDLYDLALPGPVDVNIEYLGSVTAHLDLSNRVQLKPDRSDPPGHYPAFERQPMVRSGVVEAGDLVWFKFRATNTGRTILDAEGMGGGQWAPLIYQRNGQGEYVEIGHPYNRYVRELEYFYPGQSREFWVQFVSNTTPATPQGFGLVPGDYRIRMRWLTRSYQTPDNAFLNLWEGPSLFEWEMPVTVEPQARQAAVEPGRVLPVGGPYADRLPRYIHTFEEFMTALDCYQSKPAAQNVTTGTLYLQVAPWTRQVVLKLVGAGPDQIATVAGALEVESDRLRVRFNPDNMMTLVRDGRREPIIYSQCMADMRTNIQLGPYPEQHIRERLLEMQAHGINVVATTSMPWLYTDALGSGEYQQCDAWKYAMDVCREIGLRVEGWGAYPYDRSPIETIYNWLTGAGLEMPKHQTSACLALSYADPNLPLVHAAAWLYQFHRWGDLYDQLANGLVPISVEDTWGWLRQDMHIRYETGSQVVEAFRAWALEKYGSLAAINRAWGTAFETLEAINPEINQNQSTFGACWEYSNPTHPFHDWNAAVEDWDQFRTHLRLKNYAKTLEGLRREIPNATLLLRTENGNMLVGGLDPHSPNVHERHAYYGQRRCALIAEQIAASGVVRFHSDYTTMPCTPTELRRWVRRGVAQGLVPIYFPQFDNMRDMALNDRYGTDYQVHYNLPEPKKAEMTHSLVAAYPWFQILYEEGGAPGILWEDYECDGFATQTQKRELLFFKGKLDEALSTPQARAASAIAPDQIPDAAWRTGTGQRSYLPVEAK